MPTKNRSSSAAPRRAPFPFLDRRAARVLPGAIAVAVALVAASAHAAAAATSAPDTRVAELVAQS